MSSNEDSHVRLNAWITGSVQGVGFRWWTRARALELGLTGEARNLPDGRVAVVAEGDRSSCDGLLDLLRGGGAPGRVDAVSEQWATATGRFSGFAEA